MLGLTKNSKSKSRFYLEMGERIIFIDTIQSVQSQTRNLSQRTLSDGYMGKFSFPSTPHTQRIMFNI